MIDSLSPPCSLRGRRQQNNVQQHSQVVLQNSAVDADLKSHTLDKQWAESSLDFHNPGFMTDDETSQGDSEIEIDLADCDKVN